MKTSLKYWLQIFLLPIYGLSFFMPRNKKIWLFGSTFGNRFVENPKYLYLYLIKQTELDVQPIWISKKKEIVELLKEKNLEAYYLYSIKGIWYCLRGSVYIFDNYAKDICFWLSGGAMKVNLWHGTGNKKINFDNVFDQVRHPQNRWQKAKYFLRTISDEKPSHYILASSDIMGEKFASAFQVPLSHIIVDGYPRNDVFFNKNQFNEVCSKLEEQVKDRLIMEQSLGRKILLYMPTFRESESLFFDVVELQQFQNYLEEHGYMFCVKLHPKSKLKERFEDMEDKNIFFIDSSVDSYEILDLADVLITDYSSVHTDFMLLDRPTVLFTYDFKEYCANTRESYFDYDAYLPELRTYTMKELCDGIVHVLEYDSYKEKRSQIRTMMWKYEDGNASMRISNKVYKLLNEE